MLGKDDSSSFYSESNLDVSLYGAIHEFGVRNKFLSRDELNEYVYIVEEGTVTAGIDILGHIV